MLAPHDQWKLSCRQKKIGESKLKFDAGKIIAVSRKLLKGEAKLSEINYQMIFGSLSNLEKKL